MSDRVLVMKKAKWSQPAAQENFFSRDDLDQIGLDEPLLIN